MTQWEATVEALIGLGDDRNYPEDRYPDGVDGDDRDGDERPAPEGQPEDCPF